MKFSASTLRLLSGAGIALLAGAILIAVGFFRHEVYITVDGSEPARHTVWGNTVSGALRSTDVRLSPEDRANPAPGTVLSEGMLIEVATAAPVEIEIGGGRLNLVSAERIPSNLIQEAGLQIFPGDEVWVDGVLVDPQVELVATRFLSLELRQANRVTLHRETGQQVLLGAGPTLAHALEQSGVALYASDVLVPGPTEYIVENLEVDHLPGTLVEIRQGADILHSRTAGSTVGLALASAGISLQGLDYSLPAEHEEIPDDGVIQVMRVSEEVLLEQELVGFMTEFQALTDVPIDTLQVVQAGEYGLQAQRIRVRVENGEEIARIVEDEWLVKEPVPRIEGYGTQITIQTLDTPHGTIEYWRAVEFYATSYSPANSGTPLDAPWYGQVFCGGNMQNGFVGVDLDYVPCGTPLYIPGYGFAVAMDTGAISGAWIDLGYLDKDYVPWHQFVTVYFLTPVPSADSIAWIIPPGNAR
ncbi:MAG: hypothetical protein EPO32_00625 [Anaerolineae bacterium]|nr:MAG: hypothetical protein EPO32_00625 [Anaerolineae bacterium]